jgi:hypothetical protein
MHHTCHGCGHHALDDGKLSLTTLAATPMRHAVERSPPVEQRRDEEQPEEDVRTAKDP